MDTAVRTSLITLFTEVFEGIQGDGTWFVDTGKDQGFFGMIDVSPEVASWNPGPGLNSIAAHTNHVRFAVYLLNCHVRGEKPTGGWEESWEIQTVDATEWVDVRQSLRDEYEEVKGHIATYPYEPPNTGTGTLALVAHVAFHLGSIKQLRAFAQR